jgi:uncharacterized protein
MSSPTTLQNSQDRIITVDALRGFALFGILYSHMVFWYTAGPLPQNIYNSFQDIGSGIAMGLYGLLFIGKFFSFFSFLFGLSFYLQMTSFSKRQDSFLMRYGWRLFILGIIGIIHHALWRGDILSIYVPLGFVLILARKLSDKAILIIGFILILNIPTKIYEAGATLVQPTPVDNAAQFKAEGERYYEVVKNGSFVEVVIDNLKAFPTKFNYQITSGRLIITFGFFLIGMYAGRKKWFENLDTLKPFVKNVWKKVSFGLLGLIAIVAVVSIASLFVLNFKIQENRWGQWFFGLVFDFFNAGLTIFYISGLTLLMYRVKWQRILFPLASIGKMALTSYLMQTFFGLMIFYSFGFGLFTKTSPAMNALIGIGIFLLQVILSKWWLKYFSYGPLEWIWRSLTFFKMQPIIKKRQAIEPVVATVIVEK